MDYLNSVANNLDPCQNAKTQEFTYSGTDQVQFGTVHFALRDGPGTAVKLGGSGAAECDGQLLFPPRTPHWTTAPPPEPHHSASAALGQGLPQL